MKKDAYYFPHFSNARNDQKIQHIRRVFKSQGYGIYFMILEVLREQTNFKYPLSAIDDLAYDLREPKEIILSIINDFDLFAIDKVNNFFSPKQILYLSPYLEKSERARKAALKRWNNANANANALQMHVDYDAKADAKGDASKVKESKVNQSKEIIESIYKSYPSKCPISNRSTGKNSKNKDKIVRLLKTNSENELIEIIELYISDCKKTQTYVKNFSTFLNNLPELDEIRAESKINNKLNGKQNIVTQEDMKKMENNPNAFNLFVP